MRYRRYLGSTGILTGFPFDHLKLRMALGSTNPRLTNVAEEPEPLRRWGFSPHCAVYYYQDSHSNEVHATSQPHFFPRRTPPYRIRLLNFVCPKVSAADLAPSIFGAFALDGPAFTRCLKDGCF